MRRTHGNLGGGDCSALELIGLENQTNIWEYVKERIQRIEEEIRAAHPREAFEVTPVDGLILGMYWRCVSLYRGVLVLLNNNQPEESLMLGRSLFAESLRLMELAEAGPDRAAFVLQYATESLNRMKGLFAYDAQRFGLTEDTSDVLAHVEQQLKALNNYRERHGISKPKRFSSETDAALRLNRQKDLWTFKLSHQVVHGEDAAHLFRRRNLGDARVAFFSNTADPDILAESGVFAARSVAHALYATANIFNWDLSPKLQNLIADLERRLDDQ